MTRVPTVRIEAICWLDWVYACTVRGRSHKSIQTTINTYSHLVTDDLRGVMELLER